MSPPARQRREGFAFRKALQQHLITKVIFFTFSLYNTDKIFQSAHMEGRLGPLLRRQNPMCHVYDAHKIADEVVEKLEELMIPHSKVNYSTNRHGGRSAYFVMANTWPLEIRISDHDCNFWARPDLTENHVCRSVADIVQSLCERHAAWQAAAPLREARAKAKAAARKAAELKETARKREIQMRDLLHQQIRSAYWSQARFNGATQTQIKKAWEVEKHEFRAKFILQNENKAAA
ncbi:hypothetical protein [Pannonibacter sp. P2PFMT1]|uniref:hypothetical protein n=1 Tax=Pannonibacter sp. P2PFMT1 TaxID=2003582 RepID=UPI001648ECF4|nr:hypothetical protein [Pannonibacter sp. P2PFMT1]